MRLPAFFSNLLPEGQLRDYLAARGGVRPQREFFLLSVLGADLPGALVVEPMKGIETAHKGEDQEEEHRAGESALRFSLAGVQLKFSAVMEATGGLTIPAGGVGGSWIVKLPSARFAAVLENEYAMLALAHAVGIEVPANRLIDIATIGGLPQDAGAMKGQALAVQRFDRGPGGEFVHMKDFAQVFGLIPDDKNRERSYANIARSCGPKPGKPTRTTFYGAWCFLC
jgi:serine/threonine-protein kinase HipA